MVDTWVNEDRYEIGSSSARCLVEDTQSSTMVANADTWVGLDMFNSVGVAGDRMGVGLGLGLVGACK
jgi:ElaB/YqjD/DUF883 family membrane-anchored ribosome-binding protein